MKVREVRTGVRCAMGRMRAAAWRMRDGEWFEGCYVFESPAARDAFQEEFTKTAADSPGSQIVGSAPVLIERLDLDAELVALPGT